MIEPLGHIVRDTWYPFAVFLRQRFIVSYDLRQIIQCDIKFGRNVLAYLITRVADELRFRDPTRSIPVRLTIAIPDSQSLMRLSI